MADILSEVKVYIFYSPKQPFYGYRNIFHDSFIPQKRLLWYK